MEVDETDEHKFQEEKSGQKKREAYIPSRDRKDDDDDDVLVWDKTAYKMFHRFQLENPCMSCDPLEDNEGFSRDTFPLSLYAVTGTTMASRIRDNCLTVIRLVNLNPVRQKSDDAESSSESESESDDGNGNVASKSKGPRLSAVKIPHHGGINRIRAARVSTATVCAVWNDQGTVQIWNLQPALLSLDNSEPNASATTLKKEKPLSSFAGHQCEGFAIDWSEVVPGRLASGDNRSRIHLWHMGEGGTWTVNHLPYTAHKASVEDIQWSPNEDAVFASCSADASIRLWDTRVSPKEACVCSVDNAHDGDVNVISWNRKEPLLVSGGDDCVLKIWDLKMIQHKQPVAQFKHHTKPITSVHWYPHDSTVFAASAEDNQVSIWDLSLEVDDQGSQQNLEEDVPPQLLFMHLGQQEIKEIRWHKQVTGVLMSTALDGFNLFRTVNL